MSGDSNRKSVDWSARHVRLRFELILTASLIAVYSFYDAQLKTSALLPIDFSKVPITIQMGALYAFYFYTLLHFFIRTETERRDISSSLARVDETISRISSTREELQRKISPYREPGLSEKLEHWAAKLGDFREQSSAYRSDLEKIEKALQRWKGFLDKLPDGAGKDVLSPDRESFKKFIYETVSVNESVLAATLINNDKGDDLLKQICGILKEIRSFTNDSLGAAIDEANASLISEVAMLKKVNRDFLLGRTAFAWERMWASCWIPALVSFLLVSSSILRSVWWQ
ncbi:hypothetical protein IB277_06690 [Ensifer sp. ENS07]|uniref:hypothetical protein n=1 Tax=Ensifer sp. ENS07 TaxID=2769274 RepID=UPI001785478D|nr:hypothetical protein [Ensifer sp. ENS07]MBD9635981.1 hypothetical protein [Ensifer sp. ENS07]